MKNYYKAEYKGHTFVRTSARDYTNATIYVFEDGTTYASWQSRPDLAGKRLNGYRDATAVVPAIQITAAEYKATVKSWTS